MLESGGGGIGAIMSPWGIFEKGATVAILSPWGMFEVGALGLSCPPGRYLKWGHWGYSVPMGHVGNGDTGAILSPWAALQLPTTSLEEGTQTHDHRVGSQVLGTALHHTPRLIVHILICLLAYTKS